MRDAQTKIEISLSEKDLDIVRSRIDQAYGRPMNASLEDVSAFARFMMLNALTPNFRGD